MNLPDASDTPAGDAAGPPGRIILSRYRVEKILGRGGMGEVLLAHDTLLNRRVALKRLRSDGPEGTAGRSAILKEARRASQINDRRIASIYDVLDLEDEVLIVMEYVDGSTLRQRMVRPIPIEDFWDLSIQCVEAVGAAHSHGVIHRDIKPENLMLTEGGLIKILDFGIARRAETAEGASPAPNTTATVESARMIAGTPQYMAPEAHYGGKIDARTDIFSLGAVFYEMLTTRHPFAGPTYDAVLERIMNTTPPPVVEVNHSVRPELSDVIARMLAKDPTQRFASCSDLLLDLESARVLDRSPARRRTAILPASGVRSHRAWSWIALAVSIVLIGAAALRWGPWPGLFTPALPTNRNLALLAPLTPGATEDFANFSLGAVELLGVRLQKHQSQPGFQLASFQEGLNEKLSSAVEARQVLGANLALVPTLQQRADLFHAQLDLWDTARGRIIESRTIEVPVSQPFALLDRIYREAASLSKLRPRSGDASSEFGVRGAGTLRFLLQGIGRMRRAANEVQTRGAVADLELACRTDPDAAAPRAWLANAQLKIYALNGGRASLDSAEASAREAVALDSTRAESHRFLGSVFASQKNAPASLAELSRAFELDPTDDDVCLRVGRTYGRMGRLDTEKEIYLATIARRPHCWQPWWWLATAHFREGHVQESIQAYREMVRRAPDLYKGYSSLGGLLVLRGDYPPAIDTLKHSVALRPTKIAFDNLGTAYFNSGRLNEAIDAYNQSFQFGIVDYASWMNLGDAYYWLRNRQDQAVEAYRQGIRLAHDESQMRAQAGRSFDVMIPANLATVYPKLGHPDSARVYLRQALVADSTNSMVQYCAALTCWQLNERGRAIAWLEKAVRGGYPVAWLRDSPIFQQWRDEGGFRELIADAGSVSQAASNQEGGRR